jgi:ATP-binding cassette subfamily B protein
MARASCRRAAHPWAADDLHSLDYLRRRLVSSFAEFSAICRRPSAPRIALRELLRELPEPLVAGRERRAPCAGWLGQCSSITWISLSIPPDVAVLRQLVMEAKREKKIALVGPSGAGKSTTVSLLLRFYEPDAGRLLLDGRDARELDLSTVRANMAIVPQEVLLFGGSIRDNIAYGKPGATEEEILIASRRANCHEFIERFPESYATLVGERGVKLSGGQRQRIAIARALLKNPAILILDEATSSLDSESEQLIQQALATLLEGRTSFIIAHRLSTVRQVDRIYVMEEGVITESGSHAELMERDGRHVSAACRAAVCQLEICAQRLLRLSLFHEDPRAPDRRLCQ